jgi:HTH-type transcriptional regulator, competence development regulator
MTEKQNKLIQHKLWNITDNLRDKLERGERKAQRSQLPILAEFLKVEEKDLLLLWLADKIAESIEGEELAMDAIK